MTIAAILTAEARATLPARLQLRLWLGFNALNLRAFSRLVESESLSATSAYTSLGRLLSGTRREPALRARIEELTGIKAEDWGS